MDLEKVQILLDWQRLVSLRDVQCFLGFAIFLPKVYQGLFQDSHPTYRTYIKKWSIYLDK